MEAIFAEEHFQNLHGPQELERPYDSSYLDPRATKVVKQIIGLLLRDLLETWQGESRCGCFITHIT